MINIYLGDFHPDLEDSLYQHISAVRRTDKLAQIAVVTPSEHVRKRLRTLLIAEHEMCLMGVHFLTFHALSLKLYEEKYGLTTHMICDDFFFTELVRNILETGNAGENVFTHFAGTPEGCMMIWRTIRELREARVDPGNVMDGIRDGLFETEDCEKLASLLHVYRELLRRKGEKEIIDYSDLPDIASDIAPSSSYLSKFKEVIYYGFYDLTQVQFDLLQAIVRHYPVSMFFPYTEGFRAASFTRKFYDTFICGLIKNDSRVVRLSSSERHDDGSALFPVNSSTAVVSASGMEDEVSVVAKTILKLVEAEGYPFSGIGVVARDINEYIHTVSRLFTSHKIPFVSSGSEPVDRYPFVKAVQILLSIHENDYRRSDIIDLVSSHCCQGRLKEFYPEGAQPQPDKLDLFTRLAGISKGEKEWGRLDKYVMEGFVLRTFNDDNDGVAGLVSVEDVAGLKAVVDSLINDFRSLPEVSSWSNYIDRFVLLITKYIDTDDLTPGHPAESVMELLSSLRVLERINPEVAIQDFIDTFKRRLKDFKNKVAGTEIAGVQVLDAMSARAIPFRVLFIIGMNEKVFPRNVREDPLLRDSVRQVMERILGYKIDEKLNGFEEEKLLYYLLVRSAKERLFITYQRTDDSGETRIPSWYISQVRQSEPVKAWRIPRRLSDKYSVTEFYDYHLLTQHELSARLILEGADAMPAMKRFSFNPALYRHGRDAIASHEKMTAGLTEFDGIIGYPEGYWQFVTGRGISPTSMELFALCPFSYFARHLLGLDRIERPEAVIGIQPVDAGNICHMILKRFYAGFRMVKEDKVKEFLTETAFSVFTEFEQKNPACYKVLWDIERERLHALLMDFVEFDLQELSLSGYSPCLFEIPVNTTLNASLLSDGTDDVLVSGVVDRVDIHKDQERFRITDYKFKSGGSLPSGENDLSIAAIRGQKLQPPLYALMTKGYLQDKVRIENPVCDEVRFGYLAPNWTDVAAEDRFRSFPGDSWESELGLKILAAIKLLLKGIRNGWFFIIPGNYCKACEYSSICRKNHFPARSRAKKDERIVKQFRDLRHRKMDT